MLLSRQTEFLLFAKVPLQALIQNKCLFRKKIKQIFNIENRGSEIGISASNFSKCIYEC